MYKDCKKLREEAKGFDSIKRELNKSLDTAKTELKVEQDHHLLNGTSLKVKQEKVKTLIADLDMAQVGETHCKNRVEERHKR